jgi:hypothetical protein
MKLIFFCILLFVQSFLLAQNCLSKRDFSYINKNPVFEVKKYLKGLYYYSKGNDATNSPSSCLENVVFDLFEVNEFGYDGVCYGNNTDVDQFFIGDASQPDLNNPNRQVVEGDKYGYNYLLHALTFDGFTQFKFTYDKADFYLAQSFSRTEYQREGIYRNGIYADNSFGKSDRIVFENFGFKGGLTYKLTGRHLLDFNGLYMTKAPTLRNSFSNARLNNVITPDITSESIVSADGSYIIRAPKFKGRLTGFYSKIQKFK